MKFLHTADLHIGKSLKNVSLLEDQEYILKQILDIVRTKEIDAVLIAGDVYDTSNPSAEAVKLFNRFITALFKNSTPVFIISGNHDSAEKLGFANEILSSADIHISGAYRGEIRPVVLQKGDESVNIYLLPFIKPAEIKYWHEDADVTTYNEAVWYVLDTIPADEKTCSIILTHQFVTSAKTPAVFSDSENVLSVGGTDAVSAEHFERFSYTALGHLHGPQISGKETIRYSGSPLKYSFSERDHKKSVVILTTGPNGQVSIETEPLTPLRDLRRIEGPLERLISDENVNAKDANKDDYLQVILTDKPGEYDDPLGELSRCYPHVLEMQFKSALDAQSPELLPETLPASDDPEKLFAGFYELVHKSDGGTLSEEMKQVVRDTFIEAAEEVSGFEN